MIIIIVIKIRMRIMIMTIIIYTSRFLKMHYTSDLGVNSL